MAIVKKVFKDLFDLNLSAYDVGLELKQEKYQTLQGLSVDEYNFLEDFNDIKSKNYSVNVLTNLLKEDSFLKPLDKEIFTPNNNTNIVFRGNSNLSASNFLSYDFSELGEDSKIFLGDNTESYKSFTINFIDDLSCEIFTNMNGENKFLFFDTEDNELKLRKLSSVMAANSSTIFNYALDKKNHLINFSLSSDSGAGYLLVAPLSTGNILSAVNPEQRYAASSIAKITNFNEQLIYKDLNNFVHYNVNDEKFLSNDSIIGNKNNYLSYYLPENINVDGNTFSTDLRFFNTQNQISNSYNVNNVLPLSSETLQRKYTSILNTQNTEKGFDNLNLGYNFYTKEYNFKPDKYTKFTLPDSIYPFQRLSINDSSLSKNGAYAGSSPYFSDKIFKLLDKNKNDIPQILNNIPLLLQTNDSFLTQENNQLTLNDTSEQFENNGTFLCSWLSGNENENGVWFDRYYNPIKTSYTTAINGNRIQVFEYKSLAERFFEENNIKDVYYDLKSNMVFEPQTTYFYQRLGSNYIESIIKGKEDTIVKDTFNLTFTGSEVKRDAFDLNNEAFDSLNLFKDEKTFSITFDIRQDSLSSLNSYNIFGNSYKDGFQFSNNFYTTPFIILQQNNEIYVYDNNFNLLIKNTYDNIHTIKDVIYLEQTNNLILICNDRIIETSVFGEVKNQILSGEVVADFVENGYRGRIATDYNDGFFLKNNINIGGNIFNGLFEFDLNNISLSAGDSPLLSGGQSIVNTTSGLKPLTGSGGVKLTDEVGVSISQNNKEIIFENLNNLTNFSSNLSTDKFIYNINTFNNELYVQAFDDTKGNIFRFSTERELLSTYTLNASAVSGFNLEFINEDNEIKLMSFAQRSDQLLTIDKFSLTDSLSTSFNLGISSVANDTILNNTNFVTPIGFSNLYSKYKNKQGDLYFKVNLDTRESIGLQKDIWNAEPTSTIEAWNGPGASQRQTWNTFFISDVRQVKTEKFVKIDNDNLINRFTFNFNLDEGIIQIYRDGLKISELTVPSNTFLTEQFLSPDVLFNIPTIDGTPLSKITKKINHFSKGASLENLKIYSDFLSEDYIKYLHLENKVIDELIFDIPSGTRSNLEELDNLYNYNIPGSKNNKLKIYIRNAKISETSRDKVIRFLDNKIKEAIPANVIDIEYDLDINYIDK
jgi:hypothetical protein